MFGKVTKYMYRFQYSQHSEVGTDVLALDLLRGRDHGLSDYKSYLEGCTNTVLTKWDDLRPYITEMVRVLEVFFMSNYRDYF